MRKFFLFILFVVFISGCTNNFKQVCLKDKCFQVELAKTQQEREIGLMNRSSLEKNKGMLFIFEEEGIYPFWMKNTLIPLDMIWIDSENKIVFIKENAKGCKTNNNCETFIPNKKAKYVLEVNSGIVKEFNISYGDTIKFNSKFWLSRNAFI